MRPHEDSQCPLRPPFVRTVTFSGRNLIFISIADLNKSTWIKPCTYVYLKLSNLNCLLSPHFLVQRQPQKHQNNVKSVEGSEQRHYSDVSEIILVSLLLIVYIFHRFYLCWCSSAYVVNIVNIYCHIQTPIKILKVVFATFLLVCFFKSEREYM